MIYTPEAHEPLVERLWDPGSVRATIREIGADCEAAFDGLAFWPFHPRDADDDGGEGPFTTVYLGSAGVIDALELLRRRGLVEEGRDYRPALERALERYRAQPDFEPWAHAPSIWMGETGILLALHRLAPTAALAARISELVQANIDSPHQEFMWGSPGTMLAARAIGREDLWQESAERLRATWDEEWAAWCQDIYGSQVRYLGPAHGFAGCVAALSYEPDEELHRRAAETCRRYAIEEDGLANWPPSAGGELLQRNGTIRNQWCHGAPGMVACLAPLAPGDDEHERLLLAGGELVWRAGPLAKGANLCHGTAGNGLAFLQLFARTGDELWLERARAFAMHAAAQVAHERSVVGRGRYTLWTGDPGTALYLALCLEGDARLPGFDEVDWI